MENTAQTNVKHVTVEAVVIRADGTKEDLGVVSSWDRNPIKRWWAQHKAKEAS